jgi:hypothetical protein
MEVDTVVSTNICGSDQLHNLDGLESACDFNAGGQLNR